MNAFLSWSGGKDSALAHYRISQRADIEIAYLVNMLSEDGRLSRSHHLPAYLLVNQGEKMGIPVVQRAATWETYEARFKEAIGGLKEKGVEAGVFGDIDGREHRDWVERICREVGIKPILPLWGGDRRYMLEEFIQAGFEAIVVTVETSRLGKEWLGRKLDRVFVEDLQHEAGVDLCGENGEYHTFVYDGPVFAGPVSFAMKGQAQVNGHWFLRLGAAQ